MSADPEAKRKKRLAQSRKRMAIPALEYGPRHPRRYDPAIGLIGCGGITGQHLAAYREQGYRVVALCDIDRAAAEKRRAEFCPQATVYADHRRLLDRRDIEVVDIATHPSVRIGQVRDALRAGKHVLSQKPFALDLATGEALVALAKRQRVRLAVNQNGRWAPYVSYARQAIRKGWLGEVASVDMTLAWDHTWIRGKAFERIEHVILYDFAIHWFDMVSCFFAGRKPRSVFAEAANVPGQTLKPPMSAHAMVRFDDGLATLAFHGHTRFGDGERLTITGTRGSYWARGPICAAHEVRLCTDKGWCEPKLKGNWFPVGMAGAMGELLCAIEADREPENSAQDNLRSLALCFAALQSARTGRTVVPGKARRAGPGCVPA